VRIILLDQPTSDVVAYDDCAGEKIGEFFVHSDNSVRYRSPFDKRIWFVNRDLEGFRSSVEAYDRYVQAACQEESDEAQRRCVKCFKAELERLSALDGGPDTYWPTIVEEAEQGMV
jgi:hypothetical protein